ncbi:hypothetical protein ACJX0J_037747, partial [Zea mays]
MCGMQNLEIVPNIVWIFELKLLDDYKDNMDALCCIICGSQSYQPNIIRKKGQQYASFEA